jgi:dTDP-4-dehydrorhamnose reductase
MRVAIVGCQGRLGSAIVREFEGAGYSVLPLTRRDLDITDEGAVAATVGRLAPDAIINCSAYNAVDRAEAEPAAAFALNASGPRALARAAAGVNAMLVHYGSDFVFDGEATKPYGEDSPTNPLSVYGASKLAGERGVAEWRRHYILRVESLFGGIPAHGHCATIDYMIDRLLAGEPVGATLDRTVSPSYVPDVAQATLALMRRATPFGTYHCVASGVTTWYELATELARQMGTDGIVTPVSAGRATTGTAQRPLYCALSNEKLLSRGIAMPSWRETLTRHLTKRSAHVTSVTARIA